MFVPCTEVFFMKEYGVLIFDCYQNKHYNINRKDEWTWDDRGRDGGSIFILRTEEQDNTPKRSLTLWWYLTALQAVGLNKCLWHETSKDCILRSGTNHDMLLILRAITVCVCVCLFVRARACVCVCVHACGYIIAEAEQLCDEFTDLLPYKSSEPKSFTPSPSRL
jgi:hypothetical protein